MNLFKKCKTLEELDKEREREYRSCETFEWLGKIDRDYKERYDEIVTEMWENRRHD